VEFITLEIERTGGSISTVEIQHQAYPIGETAVAKHMHGYLKAV